MAKRKGQFKKGGGRVGGGGGGRKTRTIVKHKTRYVTRAPKRSGRRRRHGGGGLFGGGGGGYALVPAKHELMSFLASGVYGLTERLAKADANMLLNKVPKPITQLGFSGGIALAARVANHFVRNPMLKLYGDAAAHAAMYQMGRLGTTFTDVNVATLSGLEGDDDEVAGFIEDNEMHALAGEGDIAIGDLEGDDYVRPEMGT